MFEDDIDEMAKRLMDETASDKVQGKVAYVAPLNSEVYQALYMSSDGERSGRVNLWVLKRILLHVMGHGHEDMVTTGPSLGGSVLRAGPVAVERTMAGLRGDLESRLDVDVFCAYVDVKCRPQAQI
ncbi:hypothetical protein HDU96_006191 [Phlyctochytrium bullatum]|nr:hypothetical protein HDU96_006191 [Phlyctochytrium bullatum]